MRRRGIVVSIILLMVLSILSGCSYDEEYDETLDAEYNQDEYKAEVATLYGENQQITGDYDKANAVTCNNGTYVGLSENGVTSYKVIPYAKQPVGDLRWKEPQAAADSNDVYEAYYYGKQPLQTEWVSEVASFYPQGEDCLHLNVWTNSNNTSNDKTVMVFFHGGSYAWGGTADPLYDGTNLVSKYDDVIIVTVDFRQGLLGYIDFSQVEGGADYTKSGNLGLLDQVEALRWIQKNIGSFGGDPNNVTIWGESSGAGAVSLLPLIDGTEGLFNRVIIESGSVAFTESRELCQEVTQDIMDAMSYTNMDDFLSMSEQDIIDMSVFIDDNLNYPERDGIVLPTDPYAAYASGKGANVDMLIGTNKDECRYWISEMSYSIDAVDELTFFENYFTIQYQNILQQVTEEDRQQIEEFMSLQDDEHIWNIAEFYIDIIFRVPALVQASSHADNGGNTYVYQWNKGGENEVLGACHAIELSYVTNNLDETIYTGNDVDPQLAADVQDMWVNFARTGDPSTDKYTWPKYTSNDRQTMILDSDITVASDVKSTQRQLIEPLLQYYVNRNKIDSLMVP